MGEAITIELSERLLNELKQLVGEGLYASEEEAIVAAMEELIRKSQREEKRRWAKLRAFIKAQREGKPYPLEPIPDDEWAAIKRKLAKNPPFKTWQDAMRAIRGYTE